MYYEQDYIMRLIKQVIRALIGILLNICDPSNHPHLFSRVSTGNHCELPLRFVSTCMKCITRNMAPVTANGVFSRQRPIAI